MVEGVATKLVKYGESAFPKIGDALSDIYIKNRWKNSSQHRLHVMDSTAKYKYYNRKFADLSNLII